MSGEINLLEARPFMENTNFKPTSNPFILFAMRLRGVWNGIKSRPLQYLIGVSFLSLLYWGIFIITRKGVYFLTHPLKVGNLAIDLDIAEAIIQRSLEALFIVLMLGVTFSVLTTAVHTLYSSEDLPFLLSLPIPATQVFYLKVLETYISAAMMPALFTIPVLTGLGIELDANLSYYFISLAAVLSLYSIPVTLGSFLALVLMRISPAGKVKEVATGLSVVVAAAFIFALRTLRPERLADMNFAQMTHFLTQFASFEISWLPSSWTSQAVWGALEGKITIGAYFLAALSVILLWFVAWAAAFAYKEGWIRSLETGKPKLDPKIRRAPIWERALNQFGRAGSIISKDIRLLLRDPTQWSQLLVLLALAGVYLVSVGSIKLELDLQRFRDAIGTMNIMFMGFLLAGIGIRMAYPIISLEGEGFWILRTGPLKSSGIVMSKFWNALPIMTILGGGLGFAAARLIDVSSSLAFVSPIAGLSAAVVTTGLGVGLGAAFPRFSANSPSEIPMTAGGLLYMALSLGYATLMTLILAFPAWKSFQSPTVFYWSQPEGIGLLAAIVSLTVLCTTLPLIFGSTRLASYE